MSINDPLIHPALIDPRLWGDAGLYETSVNIERSPVAGDEHHTAEKKFEISHLKLDLSFDGDNEKISGTATTCLQPINDGLATIELDIAEMNIMAVRLLRVEKKNGGGPPRNLLSVIGRLDFELHPEKLLIALDRPYSRLEQLTIEIAYTCSPRKGLFFIKPDDAYPQKPHQIWSQGENEDAHWWFPCHDVTNQKMTTELLARVRTGYFALSNGELISVIENPSDNTTTYHWKQDQPHPAYLVTVAIGEYEKIGESLDGLPVDFYVYKDRVEEGRRLFGNTSKMIKFFEEKFGCAYPYAKYAQVLVDDFLFSAMENTSATTMTDRCLLDTRAGLDLDYDDIVAHELAHQWWGDLVTCKDWTQIWLNESFATYSEYLWREQTKGRDEARFSLFQDFLTYLREDWKSHRRPIVSNKYRFSEELMDRHAYEKGACVLDMLRWILGDDGFFRSLSHYLNKFRFGVAETGDFKVAIEEATGQNLYWFFDQWLHGEGYPEFDVSYDWNRDHKTLKLLVRQVQELDEKVPVFRFPVDIEIITDDTGEVIETERRTLYRINIDKQEQEFYFPCDSKPRLVIFDKGNHLIKLLKFEKSAQESIYQMDRDEDVMGRIRAARELSVYKSDFVISALKEKLLGDDFYGVRMAAAISLGQLLTETSRAALMTGYQTIKDPRVRRCCVWGMGNFRDEAAVDFLRGVLENDESYFAGVAAVRGLANMLDANIGSDRPYDILASSLTRSSWQEVMAAAVFHGFSQAKEKRAVDIAIEHSRYGRPAPVRVAAVGCLGTLGKELHKEKHDDRIVDHLISLLQDRHIRTRVAAVRALGKIGNKRALPALREAQQRECLDMLKGALIDAIDFLEKL